MNKKTKLRLRRVKMIAIIVVNSAILFIFIGLSPPDNQPVDIITSPSSSSSQYIIYTITTPTSSPLSSSVPQSSAPPGTPARYVMNFQAHWQQGDSVYDATSQAKLIALTNAYYDTSDEEVHYLLTEIANEIRENAGLAGDDCLVEDAYVIILGQKLDAAVRNSELSKEKLLELERPYITVHPSDTTLPGITTTTYTFGNVDIIITNAINNADSNNGTTIKDNVTLSTEAHYEAYIIYNVSWENDCLDAIKAFEEFGIPASDIGTASITTYPKFTDSWNSIDLTPSGSSVPYVIIDTHATPAYLDSETYRISTSDISKLQNKHIEKLILLGCNAGHMNFKETNPASTLAAKIFGGFVLASDGNVFSIGADQSGRSQYESRDDDTFQAYLGTNGRSSLGWVVYRYSGGKIITFKTSVYIYTISAILDYFNSSRTWD